MRSMSLILVLLFSTTIVGCGGSSSDSARPVPSGDSNDTLAPPGPNEPTNPTSPATINVSAGEPIAIDEAQEFTLEGTSSVSGQSDITIVRVRWRQISGPAASELTQPDQNLVTYQAPQIEGGAENLVFSFEAETSAGDLLEDTVTITVRDTIANTLPLVDAGPDAQVIGGETVTLNGSAEDENGIAFYKWSIQEPDSNLTINNANEPVATVTLPRTEQRKDYRFALQVVDNLGGASVDLVTITSLPSSTNTAPVIQSLRANPGVATGGEVVRLESSAVDFENDQLSYQWKQAPSDPFPLAIDNAQVDTAQIVIPEIREPATLNFEVTVTDGALQDIRTTQLQVVPRNEPKPGLVSCIFNLFQQGCPLQLVSDLIGDDGALRCDENPFSLECPLNILARISPPIASCISSPSVAGCGQVLGQLADPLFVFRSLPTPQMASECTPAFDEQSFEHYVGVLHGHTGYSDGTIGTRPETAFERAKNEGLSFFGISDHSDNARLPLTVTGDCFSEQFLDCLIADSENPEDSFRKWRATAEQAEAATTPAFTAFRGFEWTSDRFGHLNVFFSDNVINAKTGPGYLISMGLFWQWFLYPEFLGGGSDGLIIFNHPGREDLFEGIISNIPGAGDPAYTFNDFDHVPGANMRVVGLEVFGKGSEYDTSGKNGSWLSYALDKGWYLGAVGSEDHHGTTWGAPSLPKTVMIARSNSASDIKEAMLARRFYAVAQNFNDLRLDFRIDEAPMGSRLARSTGEALPARFQLKLGDALLNAKVEVVTSDNRVVSTLEGSQGLFKVSVSPNERYYFLRVLNLDTGRPIAFSSPIWVEADAAPKPFCRYEAIDGGSLL